MALIEKLEKVRVTLEDKRSTVAILLAGLCVPSCLGGVPSFHAMVSFVIHRFLLGDINQRYSQVRVVIYSLRLSLPITSS